MLLCNRLSSLKHSAMVSIISATVFLAGTALPDFDVMAEEAQQSAAPAESTSADAPALLTADQLVELVGPVALYPDELLAITLPAATYPLDIVQAARFLEKHKSNPDLKPDEKWDESVLGLLNYPEVIDLMNKDLDWTWKLGAAVADQQGDVMDAIQQFRNQAHTAGNLDSNEKQIIIVEKEVIKIESATPEVIYVPTYKPSTVVVVQSAPYPYYYSAPYPYYYSPAAAFWTGVFVGAAVRYGVGWGRYGRGGDVNVSRGGNTVNIGSGNTRGGNSRSGSRPGGGNRPGAGGGGNRPGAGGGGNRPGAGGGGNRPSAGTRPSTGQKPGAGGGGKRPSTGQRPSSGSRPSTGQRPSSGNKGSFSGQGKSGSSASRNSQRGASSRSSQSRSRSSSNRGGGGRSGASRGGGGRSGGGGRRR